MATTTKHRTTTKVEPLKEKPAVIEVHHVPTVAAPPTSPGAPTQPASEDSIDQYKYAELLSERNGNKSNVIRFLHSKGYSRSDIAKFTGLRYQHVRNVLLMPVSKPRDPQ
jgi:hypothetical protein